jgi:hypothetical protein
MAHIQNDNRGFGGSQKMLAVAGLWRKRTGLGAREDGQSQQDYDCGAGKGDVAGGALLAGLF